MNPSALVIVSIVIALVSAAWAGLLALAEEAPAVSRSLGETVGESGETAISFRAIHLGRLALLLIAGVAASGLIEWQQLPFLVGAGIALITGGFLYMVAEAIPRAVGVLAPDVAGATAPLAGRSAAAFKPLLAISSWVERRVRRLLPGKREADSSEGAMQRDMLLGVFSLDETTVAEVMTPRLDIMAIETNSDWNDAVDVVRRSEHARLPVYTDTLDNVSGILYAKDLVASVAGVKPAPTRWQDLIRPAQFVPESKSLTAQLRDFQRGRGHLAVVVDEFGGTSGLLTLEDTLEEVVGEIRDEYDTDEGPAVEREGDDKFWVDGSVNLDELSALLETNIDDEDVSTVGGFVYAELGRVPRPGEEFRFGSFRVVVEQVVRRRVLRVYFERLHPQESENGGSE